MIDNIDILGVKISNITKEEAVKMVEKRLLRLRQPADSRNDNCFFIVTPNPEMLVLAQSDKQFKDILNNADLAIPDGIGLIWASKGKLKERVSGTDLMLDLCKVATEKGYTVGLLGAREGVAQKTAEELRKKFPVLKIKFAISELTPGVGRGRNTTPGVDRDCDLLFVAFGVPKQEKFIYSLIQLQGSAAGATQPPGLRFHLAMGVGGAFDFISGKVKRAPKMMQSLGLEWLWRLIQEPKRIGRIFNATIVFPWLVFTQSRKTNKKK